MIFISVLYEEARNNPFFWHWDILSSVVGWERPAVAVVRWNWAQNQEALGAPGIRNPSPHSTGGITDHSGVLELGGWRIFCTGEFPYY